MLMTHNTHMCRFILALSPMLPLIYQNGCSNYLHFLSKLTCSLENIGSNELKQ